MRNTHFAYVYPTIEIINNLKIDSLTGFVIALKIMLLNLFALTHFSSTYCSCTRISVFSALYIYSLCAISTYENMQQIIIFNKLLCIYLQNNIITYIGVQVHSTFSRKGRDIPSTSIQTRGVFKKIYFK